MLNIFFNIFIYLLAFYGAIVLMITIINSARFRVLNNNPSMKLVLLVKDSEENIEGVIRGMFSEEILRRLLINEKLTVLDMGSEDETKRILEKLTGEYNDLEIVEQGQKEKIFNLPY